MGSPKFVLFVGEDKQFYFHLQAANGETILQSEGYTQKASAKHGMASVRENAKKDSQYDRKRSSDGQYYFTLQAKNNEIIGHSEMYTTSSARENGIDAVKKTVAVAPTDDRT